MTDVIRDCVGKKRKLSGSDLTSVADGAMTNSNENGDTTENDSNNDVSSVVVEHISYVEFYSGVGGWTMALQEALRNLGPLLSSIRNNDSKAPTNISNDQTSTTTTSNNSPKSKPLHRYELKRLAALDHSDLCVKVFSHNFVRAGTGTTSTASTNADKTKRKRQQKASTQQKSYSIERMPLRQLEEWSADVWVMSPPCQPHTRQHNDKNQQDQQHKKDLDDPRSKSFLKICEWLEGTPSDGNNSNNNSRLSDEALPSLIFLENVVGFESSNSFRKWRSALKSRGYHVGHFHLTPTQVRLPNDRPRYYSVAFRGVAGGVVNISVPSVSTLPSAPENSSLPSANSLMSYLRKELEENDSTPKIWKAIPELRVSPEEGTNTDEEEDDEISPISSFLDCNNNIDGTESNSDKLRVPEKVLKNQSAWCFDIVGPKDCRSSCFTHSYGRFIRGTGSILYDDEENEQNGGDGDNNVNNDGTSNSKTKNNVFQLLPPEQREFQADWMDHLDPTKLRYFSGSELARLFGFSKSFSFPPDTSLKQQWKLMGNSLNVRVASKLVELGFLLRYHYCLKDFETTKTMASP